MGRTILSFRIASMMEKEEWNPFRKVLEKEDRKVFDDMFASSMLYNSASAILQICKDISYFHVYYFPSL